MMMRRDDRAADLLAAHADSLVSGSGESPELEAVDELTVRPLMDVAETLRRAMVSAEPSPSFVRALGRELVEESRRQQVAARRVRRGLVIGAAALGSALSVAGVVALVTVRRRGVTQPQPVSG